LPNPIAAGNSEWALGLTVLAGLSTGIGSLMGLGSGHNNRTFLTLSLGFSAGAMVYVSLVEILPKARLVLTPLLGQRGGYGGAVLAFFIGMAAMALVDGWLPVHDPGEAFGQVSPSGTPKPSQAQDSNPNGPEARASRHRLLRMGLFAALAMARFSEWIPKWMGFDSKVLANILAFAVAMLLMVAVAWLVERLVLGKLVNQEGITLLMATLGITYFLDGFGQTLFGSEIYKIDVGLPKDPMFLLEGMFKGGVLVNKEDLYAAGIAATLVIVLSLFFQYTSTGRALRAVADDHQAAQSIGIPLKRIWVIVWSVAGFVALVAGVIWGSKLGVQFSLSLVALKALPVVILGGLTSVPGAIIGGLIIGVGEKVSEVYLGPTLGGGIEIWFGYVLVLFVLLVRPQGLYGEKIIDRV